MSEILLAGACRLIAHMLWMPLWGLRRAQRDVALAQTVNGRAGEYNDIDLGEAEVGRAVEVGGNDVGGNGLGAKNVNKVNKVTR